MTKFFVNVQEVHEYVIGVDAEDKIEASLKAHKEFKENRGGHEVMVQYLTPIQEWVVEEV